jgi:hypothetical protein
VRTIVTIKEHVINAVAAAAAIGVGSTVLSVKTNDARQDTRIERLETLQTSVDGLRGDLERVDKHLSQVDGRMQQQDIDHER